jgi:hypothetical protein
MRRAEVCFEIRASRHETVEQDVSENLGSQEDEKN